MNYYLSEKNLNGKYNAINKARKDVEEIEMQMNLEPLYVNTKYGVVKNKFLKWIQFFTYSLNYKKLNKRMNELKPYDIIFIQYPLVNSVLGLEKILSRCKKRNIITIAIIHDLDSLRYEKVSKRIKSEDKNALKRFTYIIAHNLKMKQKLIEYGNNEEKIISLEIFDYLLDDDFKIKNHLKSEPIIIAGNLSSEKARYLDELKNIKNVNFNLYGKGYIEKDYKNINYKGCFLPEELLEHLEGSFGLIWDGDSKDECRGQFGNYLRYNNPHKTSLYLVAGIPVIVWEEAAIADFIKKNNLGIIVKNLDEIEKKVNELTKEDYEKMKQNVREISNKMRNGEYMKDSINTVLTKVQYKN